jgi:hypothetical protein
MAYAEFVLIQKIIMRSSLIKVFKMEKIFVKSYRVLNKEQAKIKSQL